MQKLQVTLWTVASLGMIGSRSTLRLKVMAGASSQHVRQAAVDQLVDAGRVDVALVVDRELELRQVLGGLSPYLHAGVLGVEAGVVAGAVERLLVRRVAQGKALVRAQGGEAHHV